MTFGELVCKVREEVGMKQAQLARDAELSQPYLSKIELGGAIPSMQIVVRIARAVCLEPRVLLEAAGYGDVLVPDLKVTPALIKRLERLSLEQQRRLTIMLDGFTKGEEIIDSPVTLRAEQRPKGGGLKGE